MSSLFMDRCDLYEQDATVADGHLGTPSKAGYKLYKRDVRCSFIQTTEMVKNDEASDLTIVSVYSCFFQQDEQVREKMVVRNVRNRRGLAVEAGPFLIETLIDQRTLGRPINHRSAVLRRDYSLKEAV